MSQLSAAFPTARLTTPARRPTSAASEEAINTILGALERVRFGSIAITLHEGRVVQVDITEKKRLSAA